MNVIILTTGISGSSVITGFLAKSGFWAGEDTVFKDNITGKYDTYENKQLVTLDDALIKNAGIEFNHKSYYDKDSRSIFNRIYKETDTIKYNKFIEECNSHSPWIWKDPRLFLTIGFWKNCLDLNTTRVIVIHRNSYELWKSQMSKRIIYSYRYLKKSEDKSRQELLNYLDSNKFSFISLEYDQFTSDPATSINELSRFIGTDLKKETWDEIYRPPAKRSYYKRTALAYLVYLKNYKTRIR